MSEMRIVGYQTSCTSVPYKLKMWFSTKETRVISDVDFPNEPGFEELTDRAVFISITMKDGTELSWTGGSEPVRLSASYLYEHSHPAEIEEGSLS